MLERSVSVTRAESASAGPSKRLVFARRIILSSLAMMPLASVALGLMSAWGLSGANPAPLSARVLGMLACAVLGYLVLRIIRVRIDQGRATLTRDILLSGLCVSVAFACLGGAEGLLVFALGPLWMATLLPVLGRRASAAACCYTAAAMLTGIFGWMGLPDNNPALVITVIISMYTGITVFFLLSNLSMLWLWDVITEAFEARDAQSRLAVTEERLRFARDLHDLIGHSLSSIAVKSELAARLSGVDADRAAQEMASVQQVARDALREVRTAVSGYRDIDLSQEIASVRSVLTAAGVRCTVAGGGLELMRENRALLAWVVREGATNILRHSTAKQCEITLRRQDRALVAEVHNDGLKRTGALDAPVFGNGLTGLTERVGAVGGTVTAHPTSSGGFLLRAVLPAAPERPFAEGSREGGAAGAAEGADLPEPAGQKDVTA